MVTHTMPSGESSALKRTCRRVGRNDDGGLQGVCAVLYTVAREDVVMETEHDERPDRGRG